MNKLINLIPFALVAMLAAIVISQYMDAQRELASSKADYVFTTCELSRTGTTVTEQECADAQVKAGYEYLCAERNASPTNHCWTERNTELEAY